MTNISRKERLIKLIKGFFYKQYFENLSLYNNPIAHRKYRKIHYLLENIFVSALKLKWTQIQAGISIAHTLSSMFFELCSPVNGCSEKVPPLYFSIFVPLYIESLYSHTVQWTFQLELGNMCGQPILPPSCSKDMITSRNRLHLKIQLCRLLALIYFQLWVRKALQR